MSGLPRAPNITVPIDSRLMTGYEAAVRGERDRAWGKPRHPGAQGPSRAFLLLAFHLPLPLEPMGEKIYTYDGDDVTVT